MGAENRRNISGLIEDLVKNGPSYNVWQAVWLGENITRRFHPSRKDYLLDQEGLRFRPHEKYEYPPKDIQSIRYDNEELTFILTFMGLYGVNSPLPRCYHEQVALQQRLLGPGEVPLQNFLDIFNNRFYWLYYQSWKKYRFYLFLGEDPEGKIKGRINSFIGRSLVPKQKESALSDFVLLKFSGIFSQRVRNKAGLNIILAYIFPKLKINVREFIPHWVELSGIPSLGSPENKLGLNSFIGRSTLIYTSRIRIEFNSISFEDYLDFLPGRLNSKRMIEILKLYLNDGLEFDFEFTIRSQTITSVSWDDDRLKLGSTLWLGSPQPEFVKVTLPYEELMESSQRLPETPESPNEEDPGLDRQSLNLENVNSL
ncbi:MAG TPA: type VI secretion system baseplate subunit TssG [Ignavibacteriales bacterium]|nr:type VI secretion system baseplate subunit TssG [Ignavibacteriales bacterium]